MNGIPPIFTDVDKMLIKHVRLFTDYAGYLLCSCKFVLVKMESVFKSTVSGRGLVLFGFF